MDEDGRATDQRRWSDDGAKMTGHGSNSAGRWRGGDRTRGGVWPGDGRIRPNSAGGGSRQSDGVESARACIPRHLEICGRLNSVEMGLARLKVAARMDRARQGMGVWSVDGM